MWFVIRHMWGSSSCSWWYYLPLLFHLFVVILLVPHLNRRAHWGSIITFRMSLLSASCFSSQITIIGCQIEQIPRCNVHLICLSKQRMLFYSDWKSTIGNWGPYMPKLKRLDGDLMLCKYICSSFSRSGGQHCHWHFKLYVNVHTR
jgi:hypothetical protein